MSKFELKFLGVFILCALVAGAHSSAEAQDKLSKEDKRWMEEEVAALITQSEIEIFESLNKNDRELFKEIFWARRDYNPMTPENELKEQFESRLAVADERLGVRGRKGSTTDMGRIFLLLGPPSQTNQAEQGSSDAGIGPEPGSSTPLEGTGLEEDASGADPLGFGNAGGSQNAAWTYDANPRLGIPEDFTVRFRSQAGFGFRLANKDEVEPILERVRNRYIANPGINYVRDEKGRLQKLQESADPSSPAKMALQELQESQTPANDVPLDTDISFFRAAEGSVYMPILFKIEAAGIQWDGQQAEATVFGLVENDLGNPVHQFEAPATLTKTESGMAAFEMPIQLQPGSYTLYLGVRDTQSGQMGTEIVPLEVPDFPSGELALSSIVMFVAGERTGESMGEPGKAFLLGGYHWKPKLTNAYTKSEELSGVFNAYGYALNDAGEPKLTAQYIFFRDGTRRGQTAEEPFMLAGEELAITVFQVPLESFEPGSYRVQVKVTDHVAQRVVTKDIEFELEGSAGSE